MTAEKPNQGPPFRELWTFRYKKFTHIAGKYWSFSVKYARLRRLKRRLNGRPLVAIILAEQMGDIIACEPVAREVRRLHPDAYLIWLVSKPYVDLVRYHPDLDGYLIEKCPGERVQLLRSGIYDRVYNLHISHRKCRYCPEDPVNPIADRLGLTFANYYHWGDLLYVFSQAAGLSALTADPKMYLPESVYQRIGSLNVKSGSIVLHTQSSHFLRDWPADRWNQLVRWLLGTYSYSVVEVGLEPVVTERSPRFRNLCGQLSLLETAGVIEQARLFIGIDSGPAHMANALGADAVILLGQLYDFTDYLPYSGRYKRGEGVTILNDYGKAATSIPLDWVEKAVQQRLGRSNLI